MTEFFNLAKDKIRLSEKSKEAFFVYVGIC